MKLLQGLVVLLCGDDPKLRRTLQYWAATCVLYVACIALLQLQVGAGMADPVGARRLSVIGSCGALLFYFLIRVSRRLSLSPDQLAVSQAVFSLVCGMAAYAISGPLRAAMLIMTVVVIVFCMFAARPRQTLLLTIAALAGMGATMYLSLIHI